MKRIEVLKRKTEAITKKRVAAYARVSAETDILLHSLKAQIDYFKKKIQSNPEWEFRGVFYDEGISGTSTNREGFQNLMKECEEKNIDIILVKSISRFTRNTLDFLSTIRHLKDLGIDVRFEKENISSLTADGELMLTLMGSFAEEESRSISENTKWAIKKRFEKGLECGSPIPFGYNRNKNGQYWVNEDEAVIVREIFQDYLDGLPPRKIAQKHSFSYSTIWQMLRQVKYKGDILLQKTHSIFEETHRANTRKRNTGEVPMYYVKDALPAIIEPEVFDAVQEKIKSKILKGKVYKRNPFTSIVICSECGRSYRRRNNESGHYWKCSGKLEHTGCTGKNIKEELLEELCKDYIHKLKEVVIYKDRLVIKTIDGGEIEKCYINSSND